MQRDDLALHAWCDHGGLAFDLDGLILPDDPVTYLEVESFLLVGVHQGQRVGQKFQVGKVQNTGS